MDVNIRKFENVHILLWLLKDLCWVMDYKTAGVVMIVPTVGIAVCITVFEPEFDFGAHTQSRGRLLDFRERNMDDRRIFLQ